VTVVFEKMSTNNANMECLVIEENESLEKVLYFLNPHSKLLMD